MRFAATQKNSREMQTIRRVIPLPSSRPWCHEYLITLVVSQKYRLDSPPLTRLRTQRKWKLQKFAARTITSSKRQFNIGFCDREKCAADVRMAPVLLMVAASIALCWGQQADNQTRKCANLASLCGLVSTRSWVEASPVKSSTLTGSAWCSLVPSDKFWVSTLNRPRLLHSASLQFINHYLYHTTLYSVILTFSLVLQQKQS